MSETLRKSILQLYSFEQEASNKEFSTKDGKHADYNHRADQSPLFTVMIHRKTGSFYAIHITLLLSLIPMLKRITCCFLASLFLTGSLMLPLGDFSLLRDIPKMYQNYTKITSEEEVGVIDFIGDYLLYGKQIFGHNEHDKIPAKGNDVQFQHQARPLNIVFIHRTITSMIPPVITTMHPIHSPVFYTGDYRNKLFRPPLA